MSSRLDFRVGKLERGPAGRSVVVRVFATSAETDADTEPVEPGTDVLRIVTGVPRSLDAGEHTRTSHCAAGDSAVRGRFAKYVEHVPADAIGDEETIRVAIEDHRRRTGYAGAVLIEPQKVRLMGRVMAN